MAACIHSFLTSTELQLHLENHFTEAKPQPRAKRVDSRLPLDLEQYEILVEESLPRLVSHAHTHTHNKDFSRRRDIDTNLDPQECVWGVHNDVMAVVQFFVNLRAAL
eukprot:m.120108 g.120108  ORF g.120108 m.120108 type:complete len:107 (-) comp13683_c0_seq24:682-1002(-)